MRSLAELRSLLLSSLVVAVSLVIALPRAANAGEYVEKTPFHEEVPDEPIDEGEEELYSMYGYSSAYAGIGHTTCSAFARAWAAGEEGTGYGHGGWLAAWAYSEKGWEWEGDGMPVGGSLFYLYEMTGSARIMGETYATYGTPTSGYCLALASGTGYASASPGSCSGSLSADASGSANYMTEGTWDWDVSPSEAGSGSGNESTGSYGFLGTWVVEVWDTEGVAEGTRDISMSFASSCHAEVYEIAWSYFGSGVRSSSEAEVSSTTQATLNFYPE